MLFRGIPLEPWKRYWWVWFLRRLSIDLENLSNRIDRCPACGRNPYSSPACQGHLEDE